MHDGRLFVLEMTAETLPRDESLFDPDNFMPKSSILIVSSPYFSMTECGRSRRTLQLGTYNAGTSNERTIPLTSIRFHLTMPSPLTDNPLEMPSNSVFVFDLVKLMKSFLSGDIEIEAPVSHIRENFDDFFIFLNDRNDAVDRTC